MWPSHRQSSLALSTEGSRQGAPPAALGQAEAEGCSSSLPRHPAPLQHAEDAPRGVGLGGRCSCVHRQRLKRAALSQRNAQAVPQHCLFWAAMLGEDPTPGKASWSGWCHSPAGLCPATGSGGCSRLLPHRDAAQHQPRDRERHFYKKKRGDSFPSYFTCSSTIN